MNSNKIDLEKEIENGATSKVRTIPFNNGKKIKKQEKKSLCSRCKITFIIVGIIVGIIIFGIALFLGLYRCKLSKDLCKNNNNDKDNGNKNIDERDQKPEEGDGDSLINEEELKEVFKPVFGISSKVGTLTQTLMELKQELKIKSTDSNEYLFSKALFDTYVISEDSPEPSQISKFYNKKITTSISINSLCSASEGTDCEFMKYLDLSENNKKNLRNVEEEINIEELTIPICLIEHTDSNIILSINCPNNIEENFKSLLKFAFENIKPETIKGAEDNKNYADINVETKEEKIYINSFSKLCEDEERDDKTCESQKKIITDKNGNFISSNHILKTETNLNINECDYNFKDITLENSENLSTDNYKSNLNSFLNLLKNYMKKEKYDDMRRLEEPSKEVKRSRKSYLNKSYWVFNVNAGLSNDIINEDKSQIDTDFQINDDRKELSHNEIKSNLPKTIEKFKNLSNAINSLATILFKDISGLLMEMKNQTISDFTQIDNLLAFKDLSSIFDSTFAIAGLSEFPYKIVSMAKELFTNIKALDDELAYSIYGYKKKLKDEISSFLSNEHDLIFELFNNLKELNTLLSSKKSKIAIIASFYESNSTYSSFMNIVKSACELLDNYYIYEKDKIKPILNKLFGKFLNNSQQIIENGQYILDNITNRLEDQSVVINRGTDDDIKSVIDNLYNAKSIEKKIIPNVIEIMEKNIFQSTGYLVTEKFIEENKKSYSPISENSLKLVNILANNSYIDEKFDEIMKFFREQFIIILNYIEISKSENFPVKSNVLSISFEELESLFKNEKINIKKLIENNNKNFLNSINRKINLFLGENQNILTNLIKNIESNLSKLNLSNLDNKFKEMLNYSMNNITYILDNNYNLALSYLNEIRSTTHLTQKIKNIITIYMSKLNEIESYVNFEFKNDIVNKYKNVINQFKKGLQSIKSNSIIKKYYELKDLSFFKKHIDIYISQSFSTLDDFISDKIFNSKYLTTINDFVKSSLNKIKDQRKKLNELYYPISKLGFQSNTVDDIYYKHTYRCCKKKFIICWKKGNCDEYLSQSVNSANNYKKLLSILFDNYSKVFDLQFEHVYNIFSQNINSYNNIVASLGNDLEIIINDYSQKKLDCMDSILEKSKSFLKDCLGINVLKSSYNYYKNELNEKLPTELNSIFEQWKNLLNKVYKDIETNIYKFKYPIEEFNSLATIYYEYYRQNISYSYSDSVVEQRKVDFNNTIKYYYNLFLSKVNQTYTFILSNIPSNEKPFENILRNQINQIKNSYNEIMNLTLTSQKEVVNLKNQLKIFKVIETNFFEVNSHSVDLSYKIEEELSPLISKFSDISNKALNKFDSVESVASSFYLEDIENRREINEILDATNKGSFIELQYEAYKTLFEEVLKIDIDDLKNKISDFLTLSNEEIKNIFEIKRNNYKNQMQEKIFSSLYNKVELEEEINSLYSKGLNELDEDSKNKIIKYIDEIIEKIKEHLLNENSKLLNELTSYSNNYDLFSQRLNQYKNRIYNEFFSIINSVTNDFYIDIMEKFYTNYTEKYLDILYKSVKKEKFSENNFLNISISLKEVMDEDIELLTLEYKNWTINHINFLNEKKLQYLNELFLFEKLKAEIDKRIDDLYNTILLPTLKKKAIYNSGEEGVSDYDFNETIINDIESFINTKINEAKIQIEKMKGNKYEIEEDWKNPDFSNVKRDIFELIINDFKNFSNIYNSKEVNNFYNIMSTNLYNNFKQIIDNFIPSFGKDYFEGLLKYNEVQKIKSLYANLQYSLGITLTYYIFLTYSNSMTLLPEDLEIKMMTLNHIESLVDKKNDEIISLLYSKFDEFLELTKNNLVEIYINYIKEDYSLKNRFNTNIKDLLSSILESKRYIFEDEYINMMNTYIKNPFIEQYTKTLKDSTDEMLNFIFENKEVFRLELEGLLHMNKDETLKNIDAKINDTLKLVEKIKTYFDSFKISTEIEEFLDNFAEKKILPLHQEIKTVLDDKTKYLILDNLNLNSENYTKAYLSENIESKLNQTYILFRDKFFDKMNESLYEYGITDDIYLTNLEKEIINVSNSGIRRLEEVQEGFADLKLENTFKTLRASSQLVKQEIQTLDLFSNFEDKINTYINIIKDQYEKSNNLIKNRKYTEEISKKLYEKLENLKELSISYYNKVKIKYDKIKQYIEDSVINIDKLIEKSSDITYNVIKNKYEEIKNNFKQISSTNNKIENNDNIEVLNLKIIESSANYQAQIKIPEILVDNEFFFDIIFKDGKYKLKGKSINDDRPRSIVIDFSLKTETCIKIGKEMTVHLNNISSIVDLEFDSSSLETKINKAYNFSKYYITNQFYNQTQTYKIVKAGPAYVPKIFCIQNLLATPAGEKNSESIEAINENIIEYL